MKKWMWLTVPVAVIGLALIIWGGVVFAQEPAKASVTSSLNGTDMQDYCQNGTGMMGMMGGMTMTGVNGTDMQDYCQNGTGMMGMMGGMTMTGVNGTDMQDYCQNGTGMMGMMGGMMSHGGMMGR